jgi:hypothetical protein
LIFDVEVCNRQGELFSNFLLFPVSNFYFGNFETFLRAILNIGAAHCCTQKVELNGSIIVDIGFLVFAPNIIDYFT